MNASPGNLSAGKQDLLKTGKPSVATASLLAGMTEAPSLARSAMIGKGIKREPTCGFAFDARKVYRSTSAKTGKPRVAKNVYIERKS